MAAALQVWSETFSHQRLQGRIYLHYVGNRREIYKRLWTSPLMESLRMRRFMKRLM